MDKVQNHGVFHNNVIHRAISHARVGIVLTCGKHLPDHII